MTDYSLLIFDWDGTLMDSASEIVGAMQQAMQRAGLPERTPAQLKALIGLGIDDVLARLFPDRTPSRVRAELARHRVSYNDAAVKASMFPGATDALAELIDSGYTLSVATGKSRQGLDQVLRVAGVGELFSLTRCADESVAKPAPDMVNDILLRSATEPAAALVIGDTEYDMAMARRAGVDAVGVACGVHDRARLRSAGALAVLDDVACLPDWLLERRRTPLSDAPMNKGFKAG